MDFSSNNKTPPWKHSKNSSKITAKIPDRLMEFSTYKRFARGNVFSSTKQKIQWRKKSTCNIYLRWRIPKQTLISMWQLMESTEKRLLWLPKSFWLLSKSKWDHWMGVGGMQHLRVFKSSSYLKATILDLSMAISTRVTTPPSHFRSGFAM